MLRFLFVFSATTFSSYNPDIAKKGACARGVTPFRLGSSPTKPGRFRGFVGSSLSCILFYKLL